MISQPSPVWSKKGERPIILTKPIKQSRSFYGALNVKDGQEIVYHSQKQNQKETITFLEKIRKIYQGLKILLIWDNAPWHKGKEIRKYLKKIQLKNLELFNFPPYSPELNPQEQVWKRARQEVSHNHFNEDFQISINNFQTFLETTTFRTNFLRKHRSF